MEVFIRLPWNLQKNILVFHRPYYFDELFKYYMEKQLYNIFSRNECFFDKNDNKITIIEDEYYHDVYSIFSDFIKKIVVIDRFEKNLYLDNNMKICVFMDFTWCILNRINNISSSLYPITSSYSLSKNHVDVYGVISSVDVLFFFIEFADLILDYEIFDWKSDGEIVYLFLNGIKDLQIFVEQKLIGITYPII